MLNSSLTIACDGHSAHGRAGRGRRRAVRGARRPDEAAGRGTARRAPGQGRRAGRGDRDVTAGHEQAPQAASAGRPGRRRAGCRGRAGAGVPAAAAVGGGVAGLARPAPGALERPARLVSAACRKAGGTMTTPASVSSEVTVGVDPQVAFTAFTEELDLWWVRGPINFYDAARAVAMVCEPGVGGRILEVYGTDPGDALKHARITEWQPGRRLAWQSLVDDVRVEVTFAPAAAGTTVRVLATVPAGGQDRGGTAWQRVVPDWFGAWCARRDAAAREPDELDRLALAVYYARPVTAARWLADAFGFVSPRSLPGHEAGRDLDAERTWLEFRIGHCSLMVFKADAGHDGYDGPARRGRGSSSRSTSTVTAPTRPRTPMAAAGPSPRRARPCGSRRP